ncbi:helix-turn-helix transcriptional regulator [Desulfobotulus mexicanus]|uniref:WYL domain-containing protein n=1 Tax=Desulfobotulus mexicanus TaxID=2586642 RepID=A0A5S5MET3_9BACT|nr:WYL domain-containing protein [Desulfobotulus mexicanus]TYT74188.1 WYL domain-containing protein [Desulfobotulus mexicanus]
MHVSTSVRYIRMIRMIPRSPRKISASEIHSKLLDMEFDVSLRTVQRDLDTLSGFFPICNDEEKPLGWMWEKDAPFETLPGMDPLSAFTFRMIETFLPSLMPVAVLKNLNQYFEVARKTLDTDTHNPLKKWPNKVKMLSRTQPLLPPVVDTGVLDTVYGCLLEEKCFSATYQRRGEDGAVSYGHVNPLGIVVMDQVMYLVCTIWGYNSLDSVRQLALHRMRSAEMKDEAVVVPDGFSLQGYIDGGAFSYVQGNNPLCVKLRFDREVAAHLMETPLTADQKIVDMDENYVTLEAEVPDSLQFWWWLLGFGSFVEVLEPKELREEMKETIKNMVELYDM